MQISTFSCKKGVCAYVCVCVGEEVSMCMYTHSCTHPCVHFTLFRVIIDISTDFPSCCKGNSSFLREEMIFYSWTTYFWKCLCLREAGRREQSQFRQIHCTVTYFIVLFLEGNKTASCLFLKNVFYKAKRNSTYCKCLTYSRMKLSADFVSVTWLFGVICLKCHFLIHFYYSRHCHLCYCYIKNY